MFTPENFALELKKIAPSIESFESIGLNKNEALSFMSSYQCVPRNVKSISDGFLRRMFDLYNLDSVEIGMVAFFPLITQQDNYFYFGKVEIDELVMDAGDFSIKVIECNNRNNILWNCAKNDESFFKALLVCAKFLTKRMFIDALWDDNNIANEVVTLASEEAGSVEIYRDFYSMLIGSND
jgi:hypothetical protein